MLNKKCDDVTGGPKVLVEMKVEKLHLLSELRILMWEVICGHTPVSELSILM